MTLTASPAVVASADGQVIEGLDIHSAGIGVDVNGHRNVTIANCRITHNTAGLGGAGIKAKFHPWLRVEDCEIINGGAPGSGVSPTDDAINIDMEGVDDAEINRVTLRKGSSNIYLNGCARAVLTDIEGHDVRGPMPRGQFVQANHCQALTLRRFSYEDDRCNSWAEDIINLSDTIGADISEGLIPFCSGSPSGVGIMVESNSDGNRFNDIEIGHYFNGAFSAIDSIDVQFTDIRIRGQLVSRAKAASDSGNGPLMVAVYSPAGRTITGIVVNGQYDHVNTANLVWDGAKVGSLTLSAAVWAPSNPLIRNSFGW
jgi:hypothetical protein